MKVVFTLMLKSLGEIVTKAIRCWGTPCSTINKTEENVACCTIANYVTRSHLRWRMLI